MFFVQPCGLNNGVTVALTLVVIRIELCFSRIIQGRPAIQEFEGLNDFFYLQYNRFEWMKFKCHDDENDWKATTGIVMGFEKITLNGV